MLCRIHFRAQLAAQLNQLNLQSRYQSRGCHQQAWAALPWLLREERMYFECSISGFSAFSVSVPLFKPEFLPEFLPLA